MGQGGVDPADLAAGDDGGEMALGLGAIGLETMIWVRTVGAENRRARLDGRDVVVYHIPGRGSCSWRQTSTRGLGELNLPYPTGSNRDPGRKAGVLALIKMDFTSDSHRVLDMPV